MRLCEHRDFQQAIGPQLVSVIAWSGSGPSGHPVFPITQGLTGSAWAISIEIPLRCWFEVHRICTI